MKNRHVSIDASSVTATPLAYCILTLVISITIGHGTGALMARMMRSQRRLDMS